MISQISFTADADLKKKAMQRAKEKGVTLKSVMVFAMEAFASGEINIGIIPSNDEVKELHFESPSITEKSQKLAKLLK